MIIIVKFWKFRCKTGDHPTDTHEVQSTTVNVTRVELASLVRKSIALSVSPTYQYPLPHACTIFAREIFSLRSRLNRYYQSRSFRPSWQWNSSNRHDYSVVYTRIFQSLVFTMFPITRHVSPTIKFIACPFARKLVGASANSWRGFRCPTRITDKDVAGPRYRAIVCLRNCSRRIPFAPQASPL